ncbi:cation:proton antiporter [Arthrobacter sp. StoSoilB13]|uniref:cation:proton antiporter n=1 Tax=Arthrobacter sp. StoSoilB13 TaxID=2830993 RepID=UPI0021E1472B|nr:cation:proton antiporter [Arthrobacter sp. StoSoilB13]
MRFFLLVDNSGRLPGHRHHGVIEGVAVALEYFSVEAAGVEAAEVPEVPLMQGLSTSLVLIALLAVAAPLAVRLLDRVVKVPLVVFEIVLGILLGPSVLGWIESTQFTDTLADFGLAMLFFVAGNEIDFSDIRGRPAIRASAGWLISLAAGVGAGFLLAPTPEGRSHHRGGAVLHGVGGVAAHSS